ncbi:oligoendopeptidase F [Ligilactobacillus aviarius]|uniref:oligoendopeptidase F n=1 Tax=Ligilactobacillus aviarius TaxID=1606 RepID=UPI0019575029|nr:oligoendopeptidase F [Ligilactobacillus aviarius]MBM6862500.1 oligoendopeptidase F [Ligilactobacillus aviarius]
MTEIKKVPARSEVPEKLTWDLERVYQSIEEWKKDQRKLENKLDEFKHAKDQLEMNADKFLEVIEQYLGIMRIYEKLAVFASMKNDQDTTNSQYQELQGMADNLGTQVSEAVAWFQPALVHLDDQVVQDYFHQNSKLKPYRHFITELRSQREHLLSDAQEELLAAAGNIFGAPEKTFEMLSDADLKFPVVEGENGQKVELSEGTYSKLLESVDQKVRQGAFKALYQTYGAFKNTFATTLTSQVQVQNYQAKVRHYASAKDAALSENHIPDKVYDVLIDEVHRNLPLLHRCVKLRGEVLNLDKVHMYDLYTPIVKESNLSFTYPEAQAKALEALQVYGDDYLQHVQEAFDNRWIDVVENKGKRTGAYSSGGYDTDPYILLNWQDGLEDLYTLVHEMGHSMHSYYTTHTQPYVYGDYPIFVAEIASTTNENLLTDYLLKTEKDPQVRAFVLNHYLDGFKGTIFRQTQFAEFEQWIHEQDASGKSLTADSISKFYGDLNKQYYGPAIYNDDEIAMEWMRIPHFYYDFYVYQYATGFAAATTLSQRIEDDDPAHTEAYLNFLKSGSSAYPIETMQKAGVDMTQRAYLEKAFKVFEERLNELEKLIVK